MSCVKKIEYKIIPTSTFKILRGCAGCGSKQVFLCKNNFRINANGNCLDIWLIYGCGKCGHTYNLPIYERVSPSKVSKTEYQDFLANAEEAVFRYGTRKSVFRKNRAEIAWNLAEYEIIKTKETGKDEPVSIKLINSYEIPVRADKVLAGILQIKRSEVKELLKKGRLTFDIVKNQNNP